MRITTRLAKVLAGASALFVVAIMGAAPSYAAASMDVSATQGLKDGQKITISGSGFTPGLKQIAAGQCVEGYTGPGDCNLQGGATFRNADAKGSIGTFTIVVKQKFGPHDCTKVKCVIAAGPLPTVADAKTVKANEVIMPMTFGAAAEAPAAAPAAETPAAAAPATEAADAPAAASELPKTGAGDVLAYAVVGAGLFLLVGAGLRFGVRTKGGIA
ncbi:neocarzinostatin apoprotein domain-containing protein [Aeromicrobium wangtongii]|uniref:neocarzinostatin apoprotein domain-containing protein n=1 Tax=Aeromicrobium wangtongii TaxID=2969247 RepID=UPI002017433E|nr:neocarzinostatin apoprotein domain-containing protein [Aeromicrobium wangtongii]MCL3818709.1 neocarzinostatin apoprotein domain-containing protein [Aeromicrobium wangtongii]